MTDLTTHDRQAERGYARALTLRAPRERVFDAIGTVTGPRGWWTPIVSGSAAPGGELHFGFEGLEELVVMRVDAAVRPALVRWECVVHTSAEAWAGTTVTFELAEDGPGACELRFAHDGLPAALVELGWERFLGSLASLVERGEGRPFGREALAVARDYHRAWTSGDFAGAGRLLAPGLETDVPLNTYASREAFLAAVRGFGGLVERVELLGEFAHGDEALLLYDMETGPFGAIRIAEHFTVADGLIARIRHVHDTAALRAAAG